VAEWEYKVVMLPRDIQVMRRGLLDRQDPAESVAAYVEQVLRERAEEGWEFYRIDTVNIAETPGCLGSLLGQKETISAYNLLTFRRPRTMSAR